MFVFFVVLAVLAPLTFIIPCYFLTKRYGNFCAKSMQLSILGGDKRTTKTFNLSVIVFSLSELAFVIYLLYWHGIIYESFYVLSIVIPLFLFLLVLIFNTKRFHLIHHLMAIVGFSSSFIFSISFSLFLFHLSSIVSIVNLFITFTVMFLFVWQFAKHKTVYAVWEYLYFGAVLLWNIFNLVPLMTSLKV